MFESDADATQAWSSSNSYTFTPGAQLALYIRLAATATHNASAEVSTLVGTSLPTPSAPGPFTLTYEIAVADTSYTVTIPAITGAEYSFDGAAWSAARSTVALAGSTVTGYARIAEVPGVSNASGATSDSQTLPLFTVATPTASPAGGSFGASQTVTLSCATTVGSPAIYYTTDGSAPSTSATLYGAPFTLTATTTVKAIAVNTGMNDSAVLTVTFTKTEGGAPPLGGGGGVSTPSDPSGSFVDGSVYVQGSGIELVFIVQKEFSLFKEVRVDGALLKKDKDYKAENGSTKITLYAAYLDTLALGKHSLEVRFSDATAARATLTVEEGQISIEEDPVALSVTAELPDNPFSDVKDVDWFINDVLYVYGKGLMNGTSTEPMLFSPNASLTRGMIVTILYRLEGEPSVSGLANPFSDVAAGQWYSNAVKWAAHNKLVTGYGSGKFGPSDYITRQDLAVILLRYLNFKEIDLPVTEQFIIFADGAEIADYAMDAIQTFNKLAIINGTGSNAAGQVIVSPKGQATRAQVAAMLHRLLEAIAAN
jgi:hypothetical protein